MPILVDGYRMGCDCDDCEHGYYSEYSADGETEASCRSDALRVGWVEVSPGMWYCPPCARKAKGES